MFPLNSLLWGSFPTVPKADQSFTGGTVNEFIHIMPRGKEIRNGEGITQDLPEKRLENSI